MDIKVGKLFIIELAFISTISTDSKALYIPEKYIPEKCSGLEMQWIGDGNSRGKEQSAQNLNVNSTLHGSR